MSTASTNYYLTCRQKKLLLIYDNVEDVLPAKALPSSGKGRLLITTRYNGSLIGVEVDVA